MTELEILNKFESGAINELSLEELTTGAAFCLKVSARTASVLAVTVAKLRKEHLTDVNEWSKFCKATFDLEKSHLHHLHKVGKMLLSVACNTQKLYTKLFNLSFNQQLPLTQIPDGMLENFFCGLTKPIAKMPREEIRAAVAVFWVQINHEPQKQKVAAATVQPALPGFDKWLSSCPEFDEQSIICAVQDDESAAKSFNAGIALTAAALHYHLQRDVPDTVFLIKLKKELLDDVQTIENILAQE